MADRLTQLQDAVNAVSHFNRSISFNCHYFSASGQPLQQYWSATADLTALSSVRIWQQEFISSGPLLCFEERRLTLSFQDPDNTQLFAQMIARTGKDIEVLIDSLPGEESTAELQAAGLQQLEQESAAAGEQLKATVAQGEQLLVSLQAALSNIHTAQLEMQKIAADQFIEAYTGANTL